MERGERTMKKLALVLAVAATAALGTAFAAGVARAEIGTADQTPAATLLLPYFEVDLSDPSGPTTAFTVNNASATAVLAHVTLWTDEGIPTFNFDVYLTGYDVQQINLRSLFESGAVPITADAGTDPTDVISPLGSLSQDINFPGTGAPCDSVYSSPELSQAELRHIRASHTGKRSAILGGCAGAQYGDSVARGYVTVDTVTQCTTVNPSDPSYFAGIASQQNILWGEYTVTDSQNNFETASPLVHIESCGVAYVGNGAGLCPFVPGDYTFYGRLNAFTGADQREPLATTFATRFVDGGVDSGNTDLLVWRDTKLAPTGANGKHNCKNDPSWFPLSQSDVVAFDEEENPIDLCFLPDNVSPPIGGAQTCFPLAAQRVPVGTGNPLGFPLEPQFSSGWLYLNLNHVVAGDPLPGLAQAWVATTQTSQGRFSVGFHAFALDNASDATPGGIYLIP
jgi:hypothetical protein